MNVFLSMAMTGDVDKMIPPNCLLVLASVLEAAGHRVRIIFPVQLMDFLQNPTGIEECDVFGLSANSFNWCTTKAVIREVHRANPRTVIILGGPHPTYLDRHCLETTEARVVFRGEAEKSLPRVLEALSSESSLGGIEGITFKESTGEIRTNEPVAALSLKEMDDLPLPAFHLIPEGLYDFVPVETSRGCLFHCKFCALPFPQSLRVFTIERLKSILRSLSEQAHKFNGKGIFITDDSFTASRRHAQQALSALREITPEFQISLEARISEIVSHDLFADIESTRLSMLQIGVECGYDEGLQTVSKDLSLKAVLEFAKASAERSFRHKLLWSYIVGFPWEKEQHVLKTINFAFNTAALSGSLPPQVNNFAPYPGTPLVIDGEQYGLRAIPPSYYDSPSWFNTSFLNLTSISQANATFIFNYLQERKRLYPASPWGPHVYLPDGPVLDNASLQ